MRTKDVNQIFLFIVCEYLICAFVISLFLPGIASSAIGSVLIAQGLILAGTLISCRLLHLRPADHMRIRSCGPRTLVCAMLCTLALYPFLILISALVTNWVESGTQSLTDSLLNGNLILNLLVYALLPAAVEECMNRGLLYRAYRIAVGPRKAVLLSALLFGLFHMNIDQFAYTFVFGLFLGLVMEATDSIFPCIACHFTLNAVSVIAAAVSGMAVIHRERASSLIRILCTVSADAAAEEGAYDFLRITGMLSAVVIAVLLVLCAALLAVLFRLLLRVSGREEAFRFAFSKEYQASFPHTGIITIELVLSAGICLLYMAAYEMVF